MKRLKLSKYILPLSMLLFQPFVLGASSNVELPKIPRRPTIQELADSLGGISDSKQDKFKQKQKGASLKTAVKKLLKAKAVNK